MDTYTRYGAIVRFIPINTFVHLSAADRPPMLLQAAGKDHANLVSTYSPKPPPTPNQWAPLEALFSPRSCGDFMYMFSTQHNGITIYNYKHRLTRKYLNLDHDGRAYRFIPGAPGETGTYQPIPLGDAINHAISLPPAPPEEHNAIVAGLLALQFLITTDALPPTIRRLHANGGRALGISDIARLCQALTCARSEATDPTE